MQKNIYIFFIQFMQKIIINIFLPIIIQHKHTQKKKKL